MNSDEIQKIIHDTETFLRQDLAMNGPFIFPDEDAGPQVQDASSHRKIPLQPGSDDTKETTPSQLDGVSYPDEEWTRAETLRGLNDTVCSCMKCGLGATRKNFVFGVGNPTADAVIIGEAPGADEDEKGEPFVGRAGKLLNRSLEAVSFKREDVFICNILKCRPPNNREPASDEVEKCEPYLWKQLELIQPKVILCLGRVAGQALLKNKLSLGNMRGTWHDYRGIPTMVTYHPAALLRNPNWKRPAWEDVQAFRKRYDALTSS
jgi:DNA polymerase